ncbi:MAG TPA: acetyl-CoA carboxylase biotin carboxyl carrier protein subunit [Rhizomicrobium sp.]|nr:acetyl-CoA carboxylase biotin carboxyl carrier protein subunit [Rhizomicrobium sp.]
MNMKEIKARMSPKKADEAGTADAIRELAGLLTETGLTEIEIEQNGVRLRVSRQAAMMTGFAGAAPAPVAAPLADTTPKGPPVGGVPSPMVGTVYLSPEPGKPPFVKVGDTVKEGATLFIVEAMKTMNPILSPRSGTIKEVCVSDAQPVEYGQTLLIIG